MKKTEKHIQLTSLELNTGQIEWLPKNPRQWTKDDLDLMIKSLEEDPDYMDDRPPLVTPIPSKPGFFAAFAGNLRVFTAKKMKDFSELKCIVYLPEDENDKVTVIRRAMKDNGHFGNWDNDILANEWDCFPLKQWGVPIPWTEEQEEKKEAKEDDFDESKDCIEVRCKPGDIWQLGEHRLMCGDSIKLEDVKKLIGGAKIDMCLTDPPYGMFLDTDFSTIHGSLRKNNTKGNKYEKVIGDNKDFKPELIQTIFDNFPNIKEIFLFGADYFAELLPDKNKGSWLCWDKRKESQADAIGSEFELIWSKNKHKRRMLRHDWFGFLSSENQKDARNRVHPTQKPVTLLVDILTQWGQETESVVDLYGGSGSILIACEQLQKQCFTMELDPHYCDVILARWEKLTGKTAMKIN